MPDHAPDAQHDLIELRPYQRAALRYLLEPVRSTADRWRVIHMPTGAGKTHVIKPAVRLSGVRHVLVLTPFEHVEVSFAEAQRYVTTGAPAEPALGSVIPSRIDVPEETWWIGRKMASKGPRKLRDFLKRPSDDHRALLTTHSQATSTRWVEALPKNCTGILVVIDECHHVSMVDDGAHLGETAIGRLARTIFTRGGAVWGATATLYRTNGLPCIPEFCRPFSITYSELAAAGYAPEHLELEFIQVSQGVPVALTDDDIARIVRVVIRDRKEEQFRPTILNVPAGREGTPDEDGYGDNRAVETAARLKAELVRQGVPKDRILVAVGQDPEIRRRFRDKLAEEDAAAREGRPRSIDFIIACRRMLEASNWRWSSWVASIGATTSAQQAEQAFGRGLRGKQGLADYPESWRNHARMTFLTPELDLGDSGRLLHAQRSLVLACLIEGHRFLVEYHRKWPELVLRMRLPAAPRPRGDGATPGDAGDIPAHADLAPAEKAKAVAKWIAANAASGRHLSWADLQRTDTPEAREAATWIGRVVIGALATDLADGVDHTPADVRELLARVENRVRRSVAARDRYDARDVQDIFAGHLLDLAPQYLDRVVDRIIEGGGRGFSTVFSYADVEEIGRRAFHAHEMNWAAWSDERVMTEILVPYARRYGWSLAINPVSGAPQDLSAFAHARLSVTELDNHFRETGSAHGGFSLAQFCACATDWVVGDDYDLDVLRKVFPEHVCRRFVDLSRKAILSSRSVAKFCYPKRGADRHRFNLVGVSLAAVRGWRGLPGGQTLLEAIHA